MPLDSTDLRTYAAGTTRYIHVSKHRNGKVVTILREDKESEIARAFGNIRIAGDSRLVVDQQHPLPITATVAWIETEAELECFPHDELGSDVVYLEAGGCSPADIQQDRLGGIA